MRKSLKKSIVIKNVIWSEKTLMHKAVRPSNYFFFPILSQSGGSVVDSTLDYQSRDRKIDPPLLRSFG